MTAHSSQRWTDAIYSARLLYPEHSLTETQGFGSIQGAWRMIHRLNHPYHATDRSMPVPDRSDPAGFRSSCHVIRIMENHPLMRPSHAHIHTGQRRTAAAAAKPGRGRDGVVLRPRGTCERAPLWILLSTSTLPYSTPANPETYTLPGHERARADQEGGSARLPPDPHAPEGRNAGGGGHVPGEVRVQRLIDLLLMRWTCRPTYQPQQTANAASTSSGGRC